MKAVFEWIILVLAVFLMLGGAAVVTRMLLFNFKSFFAEHTTKNKPNVDEAEQIIIHIASDKILEWVKEKQKEADAESKEDTV